VTTPLTLWSHSGTASKIEAMAEAFARKQDGEVVSDRGGRAAPVDS